MNPTTFFFEKADNVEDNYKKEIDELVN